MNDQELRQIVADALDKIRPELAADAERPPDLRMQGTHTAVLSALDKIGRRIRIVVELRVGRRDS